MTVNIRATEANNTAEQLDILALYRTMVTARVTNDILKTRKTQGRYPFYIGCAGHESMAAVAMALKKMTGCLFIIVTLQHGYNAQETFMALFAKLIHAQPDQCVPAAICLRITVANVIASSPPLAKLQRLHLLQAVLVSL